MDFFHARKGILIIASCLFLGACTDLPQAIPTSTLHIAPGAPEASDDIPPLVNTSPLPNPPQAVSSAERYSVVVNNVLAQEILFALARDAKLNIEIHPGITGTVTMNLIDCTLPEILDAISRQVDMRYEMDGRNLSIMPDTPYLKTYRIEYPNVARDAKNSINMSTNIAVIGKSEGAAAGSNGANSTIANLSNNDFWKTLTENIKDLLRETDKKLPEGSSETVTEQNNQQQVTPLGSEPKKRQPAALPAQIQSQNTSRARRVTYREAASVIANPEAGIISVRATSRQQASVRRFIDKVLANARRQVFIEATIVEVELSDQYQQGINWSLLRALGLSLQQTSTVPPPVSPVTALGTISYANPGKLGSFSLNGSIQLLENFGKTHVLSSPTLSVLNNQTSLLKVVDELVYFTIDVTQGSYSTAGALLTSPTYTSTIHTVPIGFMMYVTPEVGGDEEVTLNLRPTITRILGYVPDPNPALINPVNPALSVSNLIPEIQTREMESILMVHNGDIAVLGGLMQDTSSGNTGQIPGISRMPALGELFKARNDTNRKTELVVFLRPVILNQGSQTELIRNFRSVAENRQDNTGTTR
jgi:MSHA biogenesis protein MshL